MLIEELECKIACAEAVAGFAKALDRGLSSEAADYFTEDGVIVRPGGEVSGAELRKLLAARPSDIVTRQVVTNVEVKVLDPATADVSAYLLLYRAPREPDVLPRPLPPSPDAIGDWRLRFRKSPDGWRISRYEAVTAMAAVRP